MGAKNVPKTKGKGIYKTVKGIQVKLTNKQLRETVMKQHGWDRLEYKKHYDILRNKLRAKENYEISEGKKVVRQSPLELMYKEARSMARHGADYKPSLAMQELMSFSSVSSGKAGKKALTGKRYLSKRDRIRAARTAEAYSEMLAKIPEAKQIFDALKGNPVKQEQAMKEYAEKLKLKKAADGRVSASQAIPFGTTAGSPNVLDDSAEVEKFIANYLD